MGRVCSCARLRPRLPHEDFLLTSMISSISSRCSCAAGELASTSLAPALRKAVDVALADALSAAGLRASVGKALLLRMDQQRLIELQIDVDKVAARFDGEDDYQTRSPNGWWITDILAWPARRSSQRHSTRSHRSTGHRTTTTLCSRVTYFA